MTDNVKPPLWRELHKAWEHNGSEGYAAEIRALADWLVPDVPEPDSTPIFVSAFNRWDTRKSDAWHICQRIRQLLLAEADRAERGE